MKYLFSILVLFIISSEVFACSAYFCNYQQKLLAKNFDWYSGEGYIIKNLQGQTKYAYGFHGENFANWNSKYGSITFNQIGKEFPYGGINEAGLVIEQLWLTGSEYQDNQTEYISELEWIQFQLDSYETVDSVIKNINNLTIRPIASIHYLIADKTGASAVIEFIKGEVVITKKQDNCQVITNSSAKTSEYYSKKLKNFDKDSRKSINRYCLLKQNISNHNQSISNAFDKLELVSEDRDNYKTFWSIVYDIDNLEIHFKSYSNSHVKTVKLSDFDFSSEAQIEFSIINNDAVEFKPYTKDDNIKLLKPALEMMGFNADISLANTHQMNPQSKSLDEIFSNNYIDLTVTFKLRKTKGIIFYSLIEGEENYKSYSGFKSGAVTVNSNIVKVKLYNIPKGDYALACFQDTDGDNKMDKNMFGIPKNTGFSNNKKKIFGIPPNYDTAKFSLSNSTTIKVKIQ